MILKKTLIHGLWEVWPRILEDERGFFARTSCSTEFANHGLPSEWEQCSVSWNTRALTLRGMHYQAAPHGEYKLVRCTMGKAFDVAVDMRIDSPTYLCWHGIELSAENHAALYISPGLAHGFLTLTDGVEIFYQIQGRFEPSAGRGVRWNDPAIGIQWPRTPEVISDRDRSYPTLAR